MHFPSAFHCQLAFLLVPWRAMLGQKESSDGELQIETQHCPTWTYFNSETHSCQCGDIIHHVVSCSTEDGNLSDVGDLDSV